MPRAIRCDCGERLTAGDDGELARLARAHADQVHPDREVTNSTIREWIGATAKDAPALAHVVGRHVES